VDPQVKRALRLDSGTQGPRDLGESRRTGQQRLTAVQHDAHFGQTMLAGVFGDPIARQRDRAGRDDLRARTPALIRVLIYITVIAR
jgi:hypothetical protein